MKESNEMTANVIATATESSGGTVVSFGSGDTSGNGRLGRQVGSNSNSRAGRSSASRGQVAAARGQIARSGNVSTRRKKLLLQEIQDNTSRRGNITRGRLRDILDIALGRADNG